MTEKFLSPLSRCCGPAECLGKIPDMMVHKLVYWKRFTKKTLMIFQQEGSGSWGLKFLGSLPRRTHHGKISWAQGISQVFCLEKWIFSALPEMGGAFLDGFGGQLLSGSLAAMPPK